MQSAQCTWVCRMLSRYRPRAQMGKMFLQAALPSSGVMAQTCMPGMQVLCAPDLEVAPVLPCKL